MTQGGVRAQRARERRLAAAPKRICVNPGCGRAYPKNIYHSYFYRTSSVCSQSCYEALIRSAVVRAE